MNQELDDIHGRIGAIAHVVTALVSVLTPQQAAAAGALLSEGRAAEAQFDKEDDVPEQHARVRDRLLDAWQRQLETVASQGR